MFIQAGSEAIVVVGTVHVVLHVLLARPHNFYRSVHLLGDPHRLGNEIDIQAPSESTPQQVVMYLDFLQRQTRDCRGAALSHGRHLCPHQKGNYRDR